MLVSLADDELANCSRDGLQEHDDLLGNDRVSGNALESARLVRRQDPHCTLLAMGLGRSVVVRSVVFLSKEFLPRLVAPEVGMRVHRVTHAQGRRPYGQRLTSKEEP